MPIEQDPTFTKLIAVLQRMGSEATVRASDSDAYKAFLAAYPLHSLPSLSLDQYCVGKGGNDSFCWWIERGLEDVLGRYSPGSARGHLIYYQREDGALYKHRLLSRFSDEDALRYTLKIQAAIATADPAQGLEWVDDDAEIYRRAGVEALITVGEGRKLRLLACYHPEEVILIASSDHLGQFLAILGYPKADIPSIHQPVARMLRLREFFEKARELVPSLSTRGFMKALYSDELGIAPAPANVPGETRQRRAAERSSKNEADAGGQARPARVETRHTPPPLNQILYGPPGTGKTYATIDAALEVIDPDFLARNPAVPARQAEAYAARREKLKARFDELCEDERIRFVTFHQSLSYEDFVEGIRAAPEEDDQAATSAASGVRYRVAKGVFAELCQDAKRDKKLEAEFGIREGARIWKISIEEADSSGQTRDYCLKNNEARIGWPDLGDIRKANLKDPAFGLADNQQSSLENFAFQISEGDVVVCLGSVTAIRAVGVVTGEYEYAPTVPNGVREDYVHKLPVRWLASGLSFDITHLNKGVRLTLKTVYELKRFTWPDLFESLTEAKVPLANAPQAAPLSKDPYVLIIDEINRGNVSRVFGELITLIEPSKRVGAAEALETTLPYSRDKFSVPQNVYVIGTMNTADRSLTGLDVALRRRFEFREMPPQPELLDHIRIQGVSVSVGEMLRVMNKRIELLLDRDHCLGHAYFMELEDGAPLEALADVFRLKVLPLLQEYFFEDWQRIQWVLNDHRKDEDLCFVRQPKSEVKALFGELEGLNDQQRWEINGCAFANPASFSGIVSATEGE